MLSSPATLVFAAAAAGLTACVGGLPGGSLGEPTDAAPPATGGSNGATVGSGGSGGFAASGPGGRPTPTGGTQAVGGAGGLATGAVGGMSSSGPSIGCGAAPPSPTLFVTDFASTRGGDPILFGAYPSIGGHTFSRGANGAAPAKLTIVTRANGSPALEIAAAPMSGVIDAGLIFDATVDASAFRFVRFNINFLTNCSAGFATMTAPNVSPSDDPRGTCTQPPCYLPTTNVSQNGFVCIPIAGIPGLPNVDPKAVIGMDWMAGGDCAFVIDDITFFY